MPSTNIKGSVSALRALSVLFFQRALRPVGFMSVILLSAGYTLMLFLVLSFTNWWLLLLILLVPATIAAALITLLVRLLLARLLPRTLTKQERGELADFTDKLLGLAEKSKLPYPLILFLIGKDVLRGKESDFLRSIIGDSRSLLKEFSSIQALFS